MPTVQNNLLRRECLPQKPDHRNNPVYPRSRTVKPVVAPSSKREPLMESRLAMSTANDRVNKSRQLPGDESVFYSNIWSPPETTRKVPAAKKSKPLVDISQVAHVLTTLDYKSGYENPSNAEYFNIWASLESHQNANDKRTPKTQRITSNMSKAISEHSSEESFSVVMSSSALSLGPLRMDVNALRRELSSNGFAGVTNYPVSAPHRKGANVIFSHVLTHDDGVDMSWNSQFLLGLHEPIRHALFVIDRFLQRSRDSMSPTNWNVREFFSWFKVYFVEFLRNQHRVKTTVLLPLLVIKFADKRDIVDFYQAIFELVEKVGGHEDGLFLSAASSVDIWRTSLSHLHDDIRRLNHLLLSVLSLEEVVFKPAIALAFSEIAFQRYVMPRILRATRPKRIMIPWIVERSRVWGGNKVAKAYREDLSFTARFLYDHVWHPYFESNIASAMKHLDDAEGETVKDPDESWIGCTIM
ncbi:hypothetical protein PsorP6_004191 [Peronosclerospora sorghi]|uniref:Uncharacterized protein n=1 Tax=Peronosclerospora sorghi TaxID=230839 RepID=A0ACC0VL41_9STRA|nr:hypothetical protein PsorP6_004191 [Peronosclerospora sorghi]